MNHDDLSAIRRAASLARKTHAGGRKRSKKKRCPCGANTLKRAFARAYDCCKRAGVTIPSVP